MKSPVMLSITGALCTAAILTATSCRHNKGDRTSDSLPTIDVAQAITDSITLYRSYPATLKARKKVDLVGRVNGFLESVDYRSGEVVEQGRVLFTIESRTYADEVNDAKAALASARSQYDYASRQYEAMQKALESDAVSQMEVLQAKNEMETAASAINQAEATLQTARTNLGYCTVRAPFRGHVSDNLYNPGTYVAGAGAPVTLATLYDDEAMTLDFAVEDGAQPHLTSDGQPDGSDIDYNHIPVHFKEEVGRPYTAKVFYLSPAVDTSTGTITVKATVDNPEGELRDGMYATVQLPYATDPHAVMVLDAAISTDQLGKYLYTVNDSNRVVYTPVVTGDLYADTMRVISSGLKPGARYVTKAMLKVRPGMEIRPVTSRR